MRSILVDFNEFGIVLAAGVIFLLLLVVILEVLRKASVFNKTATTVVALCVSLLCIIGLHRFVLASGESRELTRGDGGTGLDFILLPYMALAIALIVMLLLLFLRRICGGPGEKEYYRELCRGARRRNPFEIKENASDESDQKAHIRE